MKSIIFALTFLITGTSAQSAVLCPMLAGKFHCPAHGTNPAFDMTVTQTGSLKSIVTYHWVYTGPFEPVTYAASAPGTLNPPATYGVCRNKGLYLTKSVNDLSNSLRNEVNQMGNYVVMTFMHEPVMTCLRFSDSF